MMSDTFIDEFNTLLLTKPAKNDEHAEQLRREIWEELKFAVPIIKQIFRDVKKEWVHNTLPPLSLFIQIKRKIENPASKKAADNHYPKNMKCNCATCIMEKNLAKETCMYCGSDNMLDAWICVECHIKTQSYICPCELCTQVRHKEAEEEKSEPVQEDLPF